MRGFGGLISFDTGSIDAARQVLGRVRLMALAESLGGVETLISHPAVMTHASVPPERRAAIGITDGLVRVSVGIEDLDDLKEDLAQALEIGGRRQEAGGRRQKSTERRRSATSCLLPLAFCLPTVGIP